MDQIRTWASGLMLAAIFLVSYSLLKEKTGSVPTTSQHRNPTTPDFTADIDGLSRAIVTIKTPRGNIRFRFYPKDAPKTSARIAELVNQGFYDGLKFHRAVPGFVIQGGDPKGNGMGGSGVKLEAEFNLRRHGEGIVGMARGVDPSSADSQFYITLSPQPHLDDQYTIFGKVVEGIDVAKTIQVGDAMTSVALTNEDSPRALAVPSPTVAATEVPTPAPKPKKAIKISTPVPVSSPHP